MSGLNRTALAPRTSLRRRLRRLGAMHAALFGVVSLSSISHAGGGRFDAGAFNFCASVRFNATAAQLQQARDAFQNGSQILADATDGQHRFGTITLVNDSGASQSSEWWINSSTGRAFATFGRYGVRGEHINMFFDSNFQQANGADGDAYTIAHEHVHHAYGVADEYSGPAGNAECSADADTAALNFSLMDNYFTRGGRAGGGTVYTLNELCTDANHDPDNDTFQESRNAESAWATLSTHATRAATAPAGLPVDAPPAAHTVTFRDGIGGLRAMLLLDRSGSMATDQRLEFAQLGAKQFTASLQTGDGLGVATFHTTSDVDFAMTEITGAATVAAADAAIDAITLADSTNIGGGLQTALGQITAQAQRSCNEIIVLLSDGDHNTGTAPEAVLPAIMAEGVTVMTVGVGSSISTAGETSLQNIATSTGGRFFRVASSAGLVSLFSQLGAEATGSGLLTRAPLALSPSSTADVPVLVEAGAESATFLLSISDANDAPELVLIAPDGSVITAATALSNPNVDFTSGSNHIKFEILNPLGGTWTMRVLSGAVSNGRLEALAFARTDGMALNLSAEIDELVFPEPLVLQATPTYRGLSVVGADVQGFVRRPGAPDTTVMLYDDGKRRHGDTVAGDGVYAAVFDEYSSDGTYTFEVTSIVHGGNTYGGEELFLNDPHNSVAVPDFTRTSSVTAVVTGIPPFLPATVEFGPETIKLKQKGSKDIKAFIELPSGYSVFDIDPGNISITAVDGVPITPIFSDRWPRYVGDFDNDGIGDLKVLFDRRALEAVLTPGTRTLKLETDVLGVPVVGERSITVLEPGRPRHKPQYRGPRHHKGKGWHYWPQPGAHRHKN